MRGQNLPNQKRTPEQRQCDRDEIALSLGLGMSLRDIQDTLNAARPYRLSVVQVFKDAAHVRRDLQSASKRNRDIILGRLLARINLVWRESWGSWETSKAGRTRTMLKRTENRLETTQI